MSSQPSAQYLKSPAPGAPATFAVDTSTLTPSQPKRSGGSSRSQSPNASPRVNVTKTGGSSESAPAPPNTRVTVVKHN
jgi:hypothetical protein